jgi:hypothetical protein
MSNHKTCPNRHSELVSGSPCRDMAKLVICDQSNLFNPGKKGKASLTPTYKPVILNFISGSPGGIMGKKALGV